MAAQIAVLCNEFENYAFQITAMTHRGQRVNCPLCDEAIFEIMSPQRILIQHWHFQSNGWPTNQPTNQSINCRCCSAFSEPIGMFSAQFWSMGVCKSHWNSFGFTGILCDISTQKASAWKYRYWGWLWPLFEIWAPYNQPTTKSWWLVGYMMLIFQIIVMTKL